jgi:peptide/nickel transport system substrate-binding protein
MEPVPVQDIDRINGSPTRSVMAGPELRTIFLGMDQKRDELLYSSVKGKNPFKDKRVRQAFYQAIDIDGIQKTVMRGASKPTALMVGPGINGFNEAQRTSACRSTRSRQEAAGRRRLPERLRSHHELPERPLRQRRPDLPGVAANLSRIGVKINLAAETKGTYFPKILRRDTSFYLLGWTPTTYDSHNALNALMACPDDKGAGQFNLGAYCNAGVDQLTQARSSRKPTRPSATR